MPSLSVTSVSSVVLYVSIILLSYQAAERARHRCIPGSDIRHFHRNSDPAVKCIEIDGIFLPLTVQRVNDFRCDGFEPNGTGFVLHALNGSKHCCRIQVQQPFVFHWRPMSVSKNYAVCTHRGWCFL